MKLRRRVRSKNTLGKIRTRIQSEDTKIKISKALGISVVVTDMDKEIVILYNYKTQAAKTQGVSEYTFRRYKKSKKTILWQIFDYTD